MKQPRAAAASLRARVNVGRSLVFHSRTAEAVPVLENVLAAAERSNDRVAAAEALDWLFWLALVELDGSRSRAYAERMLAMTVPPTSTQAFRLYVRHAIATLQLGDASQALAIIEKAEQASRDADIDSFTMYLSCKADVLAALGHDEPALEYARLAADICAKRSDPYAHWQRTFYLGYMFQAGGKLGSALETYLVAARVGHAAKLVWEPAFATARAAWVAFLMGNVPRAQALLDEARFSPGSQPQMRVACGWIALRMGLALGNDELTQSGADERQLNAALGSADAYSIGPIVAAFHDYHRARGAGDEADRLLRIGVDRLTSPDTGWALFAPTARYGDPAMVAKAERLLDRFPPEHRVSKAYRRLFAAILALRSGAVATGERLAGEAQLLFEDIECAYEAAHCLELSGRLTEAQHRYAVMRMGGELARLQSARARRGRPRRGYQASQQCREIKQMLAQGMTIKLIADRLGVSDRTVKARVADIYDAEGVTTRAALLAHIRASP